MAGFTFVGHQRANKRSDVDGSGNSIFKPQFFGKGHFRLVNNTSVDINYSPNGKDYFVLPKKYASTTTTSQTNLVSEVTLFHCERLVVEQASASGSGTFLIHELPQEAFTSVNLEQAENLF